VEPRHAVAVVSSRNRIEHAAYGICLAALAPEVGTEIWLQDCGTEASKWVFEGARLQYGMDPTLCLTIVEGRSEIKPGGAKFPP